MKTTFKYMMAALMALPLLAACSDNDGGDGAPEVSVATIAPANYGDSITLSTTCDDKDGVPLSTVKAELYYGDEMVSSTKVRTKTEGEYKLKIHAPLYKDIPDGKATLKLTLQNIRFATSEQTYEVELTRPKYDHLTVEGTNGKSFELRPSNDNPYLYEGTVTSETNIFSAFVVTPKVGKNGNAIKFGMSDNQVVADGASAIDFTNVRKGTFKVSFNTKTFVYTPVYDPAATPEIIEITGTTVVVNLTKNHNYDFSGSDDFIADDWFYDRDFFEKNENGTYKFIAASGKYTIKVNNKARGFRIWAMDDKGKNPGMLNDNGTGVLWIIGQMGINKPLYTDVKNGWWTDTDHAICMSQVSDKVYQITLTVGKQLYNGAEGISFKFYGAAGWQKEFLGTAGQYHISSESDILAIGDGVTIYAAGHDNGNVYLKNGVTLKDGDTYVLTVDLTKGTQNAVLRTEKK